MVALERLSNGALEQVIENYPWFVVARKELIMRSGEGEDYFRNALRSCGLFFNSRSEILGILTGRVKPSVPKPAEPKPAESELAEPVTTQMEPAKEYHIVGGDYFSKEDFESLDKQGISVDIPTVARPVEGDLTPGRERVDPLPETGTERHVEGDIFTETLARIYFQQEIYPKALEIYEKLILIYPEKSAYFASLIEQVKNIK